MTSIVRLEPMANPFPTGSSVPFKVPGLAPLPGGGFNWGGAFSVAGSLISSVVSIKANGQQIKQQKLALQQQIEAGKAALAQSLASTPFGGAASGALSGSGGMLALGIAGAVVVGILLSRGRK